MPDPIRVASLHRYPVKSMLGEDLTALEVDQRGCVGDRVWWVRTATGKIGSGKDTRRFGAVPGLLELRAEHRDGRVRIHFPDGTHCPVDTAAAGDRLSALLGQPVTVSRETEVTHFDDGPVSLIGRASVAALSRERDEDVSPARFRANVVLDTADPFIEDTWVGRDVVLGTALLRVTMTSPRCVMINAKTADLPAQHGNLAAVGRLNESCLGVIATVRRPGLVRVGDALTVQ